MPSAFLARAARRVKYPLALGAAAVHALCATHTAFAAEHEFRVLHHEAVQITHRVMREAGEKISFEAYGRHFALTLTPNERIRRAMSTSGGQTMPMQGSVDGIAGSWVRITRSPSGWRGIVSDGLSLYAIEPAADIAGSTVEPLTVSGSTPVVYRLDDALLPLDNMSCDIAQPDTAPTASTALEEVTRELHIQAAQLTMMKQVRVGVVADYEFSTQFAPGTTPEDAIIARMNIVDGIFTNQVGVKMSLAPLTLFKTASDPFTKTKAGELLTELRNYRGGSQTQLALGLTHLMTGRDLDGDTVGIAYIGSVCDGKNAASLSEGRRSTLQSALIAAHEIGHNFNAPHDGEAGSVCESTPQTFLMAPRLNGNDQFSACSIAQMRPKIASAACLRDYMPPDAAVEITNNPVEATVNTPFTTYFTLRANGDDASDDVTVTATVPASLTVQSATASGQACSVGAGTVSCAIGTIASGETRQIDLAMTATEAGNLRIEVTLDSSNDSAASDNTGTITVTSSTAPMVAVPTPPATGGTTSDSGGGGGGRVDLTLLAVLGAALAVSRRKITRR